MSACRCAPAAGWAWPGSPPPLAMTLGWLWQRRARQCRHRRCGLVGGRGRQRGAVRGAGRRRAVAARAAGACSAACGALRLACTCGSACAASPRTAAIATCARAGATTSASSSLFFQVQALLVALFSLPFLAVARNPVDGVTPLARWRASRSGWPAWRRSHRRPPAGALPRRSRATAARPAAPACGASRGIPNYFFEWLHWFAYVLLAVGSPLWWLALGRAGGDVRVPALGQRHSLHRGAGAAHARRGLPRLPAHHADAVPVVSRSRPTRTTA